MSAKNLTLIYTLSCLITGCASFYDTQPAAPVFGGSPVKSNDPQTRPEQTKKTETAPATETSPLKDYSSTGEVEVIVAPEQTQESDIPTPGKAAPSQEAPVITTDEPKEKVVEQHKPMTFEPFESPVLLSPAVGALVSNATHNSQSGNLDSAVTTIERAIRIEPRNPNLYYKLAVIRLKQSKPRLAEDLAKKSALLASKDRALKKHSWLLIAKAREMQQDFEGAKEARNKANGF